jgi:hypothetical protein
MSYALRYFIRAGMQGNALASASGRSRLEILENCGRGMFCPDYHFDSLYGRYFNHPTKRSTIRRSRMNPPVSDPFQPRMMFLSRKKYSSASL